MNRRAAFLSLRRIFLMLERSTGKIFGQRSRKIFTRICFKIKVKIFPEYGVNIPDFVTLDSSPHQSTWLPPKIPDWVIEEMKILGTSLDSAIYPSEQFIASCQYYSYPIIKRPGEIYRDLMSNCSSAHYTHCFAIPWLKRGGADLVTLWHIQCVTEMRNTKVLVLLTEPGESPWLSKIPGGVDTIDTSKYVGEINHDLLVNALTRLLIQLQIDVLHIINSRHTWEAVKKFGAAIHQNTRIFASLYCNDYDIDGIPVGYANDYLPSTYLYLERIISDNEEFPRLLREKYGYPPEIFKVIKSPASARPKQSARRVEYARKVLWAGRLDRQKRPDLLLAIAQSMPDTEFHVIK